MKTHISGAAATLLLLAGVSVAAAETVIIQPEQRTVIREYVQKKPLASIDLPGVELNIGTPIPDTVELHTIEAPDVPYQYTVISGRTYVVDPQTREVIDIIE